MQFYPSISSGYQKFHFINNDKCNNTSCRFYNNGSSVMFSAGHNYLFPNFRHDMGADNANIMADSGGYQLITGAKTVEEIHPAMPEILKWLEYNCDIGINLDISPSIKDITFKNALELSYNNFKYFADNRIGNIKLLNVLQGSNIKELNQWFNKVNVFDFDGWAVGGLQNNLHLIDEIFSILHDAKHIHFLGIYDFNIIRILKQCEEISGIKISYDTSLPSRLATSNYILNGIDIIYNDKLAYLDKLIYNINEINKW